MQNIKNRQELELTYQTIVEKYFQFYYNYIKHF